MTYSNQTEITIGGTDYLCDVDIDGDYYEEEATNFGEWQNVVVELNESFIVVDTGSSDLTPVTDKGIIDILIEYFEHNVGDYLETE